MPLSGRGTPLVSRHQGDQDQPVGAGAAGAKLTRAAGTDAEAAVADATGPTVTGREAAGITLLRTVATIRETEDTRLDDSARAKGKTRRSAAATTRPAETDGTVSAKLAAAEATPAATTIGSGSTPASATAYKNRVARPRSREQEVPSDGGTAAATGTSTPLGRRADATTTTLTATRLVVDRARAVHEIARTTPSASTTTARTAQAPTAAPSAGAPGFDNDLACTCRHGERLDESCVSEHLDVTERGTGWSFGTGGPLRPLRPGRAGGTGGTDGASRASRANRTRRADRDVEGELGILVDIHHQSI